MNVVINGNAEHVADGCTVEGLLDGRLESTKGVAVAVNAEVVPRSTWSSRSLAEGDHVELLTAAQGG